MITFNQVSKVYQDKTVLSDITFDIKDHEFFVLIGESGSGKTTLLKMLNRLVEPTTGQIIKDEQDLTRYSLRQLRLDTGYVLQQATLFPNLTVLENILIIPEMKKWPKQQQIEEAKRLLDKVGLVANQYINRFPSELSGGEKQRVGILRAIITQPKVLLMDEPFSALDPISKRNLQQLIKALHEDYQMTIVFVTHDMQEALMLGNRIGVMKKGRILQIDTPKQIIENPASDAVKAFFKGEIYE